MSPAIVHVSTRGSSVDHPHAGSVQLDRVHLYFAHARTRMHVYAAADPYLRYTACIACMLVIMLFIVGVICYIVAIGHLYKIMHMYHMFLFTQLHNHSSVFTCTLVTAFEHEFQNHNCL